jgi:hypothetical protein
MTKWPYPSWSAMSGYGSDSGFGSGFLGQTNRFKVRFGFAGVVLDVVIRFGFAGVVPDVGFGSDSLALCQIRGVFRVRWRLARIRVRSASTGVLPQQAVCLNRRF